MPFNYNCPGCSESKVCNDSTVNKFASTDIKYTGPNLPGTGIQTCDDLSVVLQKIDYAISLLEAITAPTTTTTTTTTSI